MNQNEERLKALAQKWISGTISEAEKKEFLEWYNADPTAEIEIPPEYAASEDELRLRMLKNILLNNKEQKPSYRRKYLYAAAVIILLVGAPMLWVALSRKVPPSASMSVSKVAPADSIVPGSDKAILLLDDGTEIILDAAASGDIASQKNTRIIKLKTGELSYRQKQGGGSSQTYNTLSTPRGGQYAVALTDGTKVWLNSSSSLRYPVTFTSDERRVELSGEAYFEVAKDAGKPFKVITKESEVKVYGTAFNIMAYLDEQEQQTTLVEGSVQVSNTSKSTMLMPGEQAVLKNDGRLRVVKDADMEKALAWKNGKFSFSGDGIESIMRQLTRWYDIEVSYQGKVSEHFSGALPRNVSIDKVFQMLQLTGAVKFEVSGRKVIVRP